jgi:hypothetical protein
MYVLSPPEQHHKIEKEKHTHTHTHTHTFLLLEYEYTFILFQSPNLAKHTYGLSPLQQHQKIAKK